MEINSFGVIHSLDEALRAAKTAENDRLYGMYPVACVVLASRIRSLEAKLAMTIDLNSRAAGQ